MLFNSIDFMIFFPIVIAFYFIIPRKFRYIWLLVASYYFYMSWNAKYALLIGFSTLVTWISGLLIGRFSHDSFKKKLFVAGSLIINLGILFLFKYSTFFLDNIYNTILSHLGLAVVERRRHITLPVGISFYTFQALGYTIDVYRGDIKAEKNLLRYALFVSFFPQLVAGPIERSKNLLSQIQNVSNFQLWNIKRITSGAILMIWGLFMKMVIADRISIIVDNVFNNYRMYGSTELIIAAICFAIQIYCDFGSYSMIAIGAAKIMGFTLMENFNTPYFSCNIREFWGRWHISLSTWFRDYLYIPLGGNKKGKLRKALNLMIVFLVSGFWHGVGWNYICWGGIHGLYHIISDWTKTTREKIKEKMNIKTDCFSWKLLQMLVTFVLVVFAWIFFRSGSITDALIYIKRIFVSPSPWLLFYMGAFDLGLSRIEFNILIFSIFLLLLVDLVRYKKNVTIDVFLMEQNLWFEWTVIIGLIVMIFVYGEYGPTFDAKQFIYFQF